MQPPSCVMVFAYLALIGSLLVVVTAAIPAKEAASDTLRNYGDITSSADYEQEAVRNIISLNNEQEGEGSSHSRILNTTNSSQASGPTRDTILRRIKHRIYAPPHHKPINNRNYASGQQSLPSTTVVIIVLSSVFGMIFTMLAVLCPICCIWIYVNKVFKRFPPPRSALFSSLMQTDCICSPYCYCVATRLEDYEIGTIATIPHDECCYSLCGWCGCRKPPPELLVSGRITWNGPAIITRSGRLHNNIDVSSHSKVVDILKKNGLGSAATGGVVTTQPTPV